MNNKNDFTQHKLFQKLEEKIEKKEITREEFADFYFKKILCIEKCPICGKEKAKAIKKIEDKLDTIEKLLTTQQKNEEIWRNINNTSFIVEKVDSKHKFQARTQSQKKRK